MIVLASSSQTRANILKEANIDFIQRSPYFNEDIVKETNPEKFVYEITVGKMNEYMKQYKDDLPFVVADSIVVCDDQILRKAKDIVQAQEYLVQQSGNCVSIATCMIYKAKDIKLIDISITNYKFAKFKEEDLKQYLQSNEWFGKAGACMVEGFCKNYIENIFGYESTAMGLCIEKLKAFMD